MANFNYYRIATTEPIVTKFSTIDYVHEIKFGTWLLGKWVKLNVFVPFICTLFPETRAQVRPVDGFLRTIA